MKNIILQKFIQHDNIHEKNIIQRMRQCYHSVSLKEINPYHMENDIWSHTLLVYNNVSQDLTYPNNEILLLAALFHDIGKIDTRGEFLNKADKPCVRFLGHEYASLQYLFDAWGNKFFTKVSPPNPLRFFNMIKAAILINNHNLYYTDIKNNKLYKYYNYDENLFMLGEYLAQCDKNGRFVEPDAKKLTDREFHLITESDASNIPKLDKYVCVKGVDTEMLPADTDLYNGTYTISTPGTHDHDVDVWLYCGLPGSGKDTLAENNDYKIVSFNDIRMKKYQQIHKSISDGNNEEDPKEAYKKAYNYFTENKDKINLMEETKNELKELKDGNKKIAICNTNLKKSYRNSLVSIIRQVYGHNAKIGCKFIICDRDTCIQRDAQRHDKTVSKNVIEHFSKNINLPTMSEGYDIVSYITNYNS